MSEKPGADAIEIGPDGYRNVMTRSVSRHALSSRYFQEFNKVDIADYYRQYAVAMEMKWVVKGDDAGKARIATTIFGQCVVDTMLAYKMESHVGHRARSMTTKDFVEELATLMVDNELNGAVSRPTASSTPSSEDTERKLEKSGTTTRGSRSS